MYLLGRVETKASGDKPCDSRWDSGRRLLRNSWTPARRGLPNFCIRDGLFCFWGKCFRSAEKVSTRSAFCRDPILLLGIFGAYVSLLSSLPLGGVSRLLRGNSH